MQEPVPEALLVSQPTQACHPLLISTENHGKSGVCAPLIVVANGKLPLQLDKAQSTWLTISDAA